MSKGQEWKDPVVISELAYYPISRERHVSVLLYEDGSVLLAFDSNGLIVSVHLRKEDLDMILPVLKGESHDQVNRW